MVKNRLNLLKNNISNNLKISQFLKSEVKKCMKEIAGGKLDSIDNISTMI